MTALPEPPAGAAAPLDAATPDPAAVGGGGSLSGISLDEAERADADAADEAAREVAGDVAQQRLAIVNVAFSGTRGETPWVLIDAGLHGSAGAIQRAAAERFGSSPPAAVILTHGHFDHVGALETLIERWDVPVYAHPLESPYLDGTASYPPPDPSVGGGLMSTLSRFFPRGPVDVSANLADLPEDGSVPGMPGWRWIHTPGHTPGHVSLWRASDRILISADACITTQQESAYAAMTQQPELHGPPAYFTQDWQAARESVRALAALHPEVIVPGHGRPLRGEGMRLALDLLARDFDAVARPRTGTYVEDPARAGDGTAYR
jgi:glyoxylase-like metal-dependent hydrolase (beta-lactamase superfamily II)